MARRRQVNYWASRGGFCTTLNGKQIVLAQGPDDAPDGPTFTAALAEYKGLLELSRTGQDGDATLVRAIMEHYCQWLETNRKATTFQLRMETFQPFVGAFGDKQIRDLKRFTINQWLDAQTGWGPTRRNIALAGLSAAFNWAIKQELTTKNPVKGIDQAPRQSRGKEAYITPTEYQIIRAGVTLEFRDFITLLYETGARPGEIAQIRGADYDAKLEAIVYPHKGRDDGYKHKTHHHGKDRVIMLTGEALRIVKERMQRFGKDFLFARRMERRNGPKRKPKTKSNIALQMWNLAQRLNMPNLTAYSFRHTYATDWIIAGKSIEMLSELIGSSADNIRRHYPI